ncbi:NAD(P)H-hydrate dehydratase [Levilactobacillus bambusae]|uniref:ADP-dependent (S)-NAD(P)H-hydrate dehydratase n=1 Tax=Levilactobacillus bambusae TaxID=2024736 RepID=A0A2V1N5Q7_9LACO|nr:NAD(P)H-hydrate dehydratase [Levilactobacillus bambusae]PWG01085.1 NAD(P)H-hydrate dehydratase [Levilactobacillus bambusae]
MTPIRENILLHTIRKRPADSFKGTYGHVTLIGGNVNYGGAIIMASSAAVYSGAGLVSTLTDPVNRSSLHSWCPEAMFADFHDQTEVVRLTESADVVVLGPGLGTDALAQQIVQTVFTTVKPRQVLVVDGSAITLVAQQKLQFPDAEIILTPHQMEWQRLSGISIPDQTESANQAAVSRLKATVVLKSHRTEVYTSTGVYQNTTGTPAQATGGMGDTLAGIVGGFVAQFSNHSNAVLAAVYTHSAIADQLAENQYVVLPHQIIQNLPAFMKVHEAK